MCLLFNQQRSLVGQLVTKGSKFLKKESGQGCDGEFADRRTQTEELSQLLHRCWPALSRAPVCSARSRD